MPVQFIQNLSWKFWMMFWSTHFLSWRSSLGTRQPAKSNWCIHTARDRFVIKKRLSAWHWGWIAQIWSSLTLLMLQSNKQSCARFSMCHNPYTWSHTAWDGLSTINVSKPYIVPFRVKLLTENPRESPVNRFSVVEVHSDLRFTVHPEWSHSSSQMSVVWLQNKTVHTKLNSYQVILSSQFTRKVTL